MKKADLFVLIKSFKKLHWRFRKVILLPGTEFLETFFQVKIEGTVTGVKINYECNCCFYGAVGNGFEGCNIIMRGIGRGGP